MSNLKDVRIKSVTITLDKQRNLKFDLNAFAELEDAYGNIEDAVKQMEKGSIKALRAVLWSGLIHEDEELTQKNVGALIGLADLQSLSKSLADALQAQMPVAESQPKKVKKSGTEEKN